MTLEQSEGIDRPYNGLARQNNLFLVKAKSKKRRASSITVSSCVTGVMLIDSDCIYMKLYWPCGDASRLLSCFTLVVALVLFASDSGINYIAWVKHSAESSGRAPRKFSVIYQENNNNGPQICMTDSYKNAMLCIRAFNSCALYIRAHACLTVVKPFGSHLAFSQSQNPLSLSFSICVIWVFPSGITHVLSLLWSLHMLFQGLNRTDPLQLCSSLHQLQKIIYS